MNIPQRLWRVVKGHLILARQHSREEVTAADVAEARALAEAVAELSAQVEAARRATVPSPAGTRRLPPTTGTAKRNPLEEYFRVLKLSPDADLAALEVAYQARLAEIRPELHPEGSPLRQAAQARRAAVVDAYERLRDAINITETRFEKLEFDE